MTHKMVIHTQNQLSKAARVIATEFKRCGEKGILLTVGEYRPPAKRAQVAKLHIMVKALADHLGWEFGELKDDIKRRHGPFRDHHFDPSLVTPKSWGDLTREEAAVLIEHVYQLGAEHGFAFEE